MSAEYTPTAGAKTMKISEARAKLFDLVDLVTEDSGAVVLIEHRDREKQAALVSRDHLEYLERTVRELRKLTGSTFRLEGSIQIAEGMEVEDILREIREDAARRFDAKLKEFE